MSHKELLEYLKDICAKNGGVSEWAKKNKMAHTYVYSVLRGDAKPGAKILKALKVRKVYCFLSKGQTVTMNFEDISN